MRCECKHPRVMHRKEGKCQHVTINGNQCGCTIFRPMGEEIPAKPKKEVKAAEKPPEKPASMEMPAAPTLAHEGHPGLVAADYEAVDDTPNMEAEKPVVKAPGELAVEKKD